MKKYVLDTYWEYMFKLKQKKILDLPNMWVNEILATSNVGIVKHIPGSSSLWEY